MEPPELPVEPNLWAILLGVGIVAASVVVGFVLGRLAAKRVDPNDVLRAP